MLKGSKTYITAAVTVVFAVSAFYLGQLDAQTAIGLVLGAAAAAGLRHGITSEINRIAPCLAICLLALALVSCGTIEFRNPVQISTQDPAQTLASFTVEDLDAADAEAVAAHDALGHACYPALGKFIATLPGTTAATTVAGAFSAFEAARIGYRAVQAGAPDYLLTGCGPLYAQAHGDFLRGLAALGSARL